jgi:NAD(P)H-dependent flavin oxidoreductase YrpB (nitropropane dioxygenase family)
MVGHPKHVKKACDLGADIICAQGGEAGGHTGDIPFSILVPACADIVAGYTSPLTGKPVALVAAGGVSGGRSLAAALMLGAQAVWVGTRFVSARESNASEYAKKALVAARFEDVIKSTFWTGRPLRAYKTPLVADWEENRQAEIKGLTSRGISPRDYELDRLQAEGKLTDEIMDQVELRYVVLFFMPLSSFPFNCYHANCVLLHATRSSFATPQLNSNVVVSTDDSYYQNRRPLGIVVGLVNKPDQTAGEIVDEIVGQAARLLGSAGNYVDTKSKL